MSVYHSTFSMEAFRSSVLIWRMFIISTLKASIFGAEFQVTFGNFQEHKIRRYWECVQYYSKVAERTFWRNSECEVLGVFIIFLGDIGISQWSSDQMSEGKCMCLRLFRSVCWTDDRHSRSSRKMERSRTQVVFVLPRCSWYRWNSSWKYSQDFHHCLFLNKIQDDLETRRIQLMSMFNDIVWNANDQNRVSNTEKLRTYGNTNLDQKAMELHSWQDCTAIRRDWSCCIQRCQCFESWRLEAKEKKNIRSF